MNTKPVVSVGMPVYNGERYIADALASVLGQDYEKLEVLIFDNASGDQTQEICTRFASTDARVQYHRNEENIGAAANFTRAFERSTGKYFMVAAHDDLWHRSFISRCVEVLESNPEAAVCCTSLNQINEEGEVVALIAPNFEALERDPASRVRSLLSHPAPWFAICGLFRIETLRKCRPFQRVWGSDVVMLTELCMLGQIATVSEPLFSYRVYQQKSFSNTMATIDPSSEEKSSLQLWKDLSLEVLRATRRSKVNRIVAARVWIVAAFTLSMRWPSWIKEDLDQRYHPKYIRPALLRLEKGETRSAAWNAILAMLHNPFYLFSYSIWLLLLPAVFGYNTYMAIRRIFRHIFPRRV